MSGLSHKVAALVVTSSVATVIEGVSDIGNRAREGASVNDAVQSAIVLERVIRMLPFSNENHILVSGHSVKVPFGSSDHPTDDLVTVLLGYAGSYQLRSDGNRFVFKRHAALGLEGDGNARVGVYELENVCAGGKGENQCSQT